MEGSQKSHNLIKHLYPHAILQPQSLYLKSNFNYFKKFLLNELQC